MAIEEYRIWAGIDAPDDDQIGTTVGIRVPVAPSTGLLWYLKRAGLTLAPAPPESGRLYPRPGYVRYAAKEWRGSQVQYEGLSVYEPTTLYVITEDAEAVAVYLGQNLLFEIGSAMPERTTSRVSADTIALSKSARIVSLIVSGAARVRLYRSEEQRDADSSRPFTTPSPAGQDAVLADWLFEGAEVRWTNPVVDVASDDGTYWVLVDGEADVDLIWEATA